MYRNPRLISMHIKLPFVIDDPVVGRVLYSSTLIKNVALFFSVLALIPNIVLYFGEDPLLNDYLPTSLFMVATVVPLILFIFYLIQTYFVGSIEIGTTELIHNHSKFSGKGIITYNLNSIETFIFEKLEPTSQYKLYFVDYSGKRHVVIDKFLISVGDKEIERFLSKLKQLTGLPVKKIETKAN